MSTTNVIHESRFVLTHLEYLKKLKGSNQSAVGLMPLEWVKGLEECPAGLPEKQLDRHYLHNLCQDKSNDLLFCYACTMAWGSQGKGTGGRKHVISAWKKRDQIIKNMETLRENKMSRQEAYALFSEGPKIEGLGPAYWTKLLYFFSPDKDHYIMDQWTAKSINLLTGLEVVRLDGAAVSRQNKSGNYVAYCEEVDALAELIGTDGETAEQQLVSEKNGAWRKYVKSHFDYNSAPLKSRYPHLAKLL